MTGEIIQRRIGKPNENKQRFSVSVCVRKVNYFEKQKHLSLDDMHSILYLNIWSDSTKIWFTLTFYPSIWLILVQIEEKSVTDMNLIGTQSAKYISCQILIPRILTTPNKSCLLRFQRVG